MFGKHACSGSDDMTMQDGNEAENRLHKAREQNTVDLRDRVYACTAASVVGGLSFSLLSLLLVLWQLVSGIQSTYLDGVTEMRYEKFCPASTVHSTKQLIAQLNVLQAQAIQKLLLAKGANAELIELIEPVFHVTQTMLSRATESSALAAEFAYAVQPHKRVLGKVSSTVKVIRCAILMIAHHA